MLDITISALFFCLKDLMSSEHRLLLGVVENSDNLMELSIDGGENMGRCLYDQINTRVIFASNDWEKIIQTQINQAKILA